MRIVVAVLFLAATSAAIADSWPSAQPIAAVSDNAKWLVRVVPGESIGDVYGFAGSPTGPYAEAILFQYDEDLGTYEEVTRYRTQNPVAPVDILVTNNGSLIALDNWHNFGIGVVVAAYDTNGELIRTLALSDIFSSEQLPTLDRSVSSIWWRCGPAILDPVDSYFGVWDSLGRTLTINYVSGAVKVVDESGYCVDDDT